MKNKAYNQSQIELNEIKNLIKNLNFADKIIKTYDGKTLNKRVSTKFEKEKDYKKFEKVYMDITYNSICIIDHNNKIHNKINIPVHFDNNKKIDYKATRCEIIKNRKTLDKKLNKMEKVTLEYCEDLEKEKNKILELIREHNNKTSLNYSLQDIFYLNVTGNN